MIVEILRQALGTLRAYAQRSALGALAIAVAVATIVIVVTALDGIRLYTERTTARTFGADTFVIAQVAAPGRVFEVTSKGEIAWEWVNPFSFRMPNGNINPNLFRAHRYSRDHAALRDRELDPRKHAATNRMYGLAE